MAAGSSRINPFNAYAAGFISALSIYSLGYSDLYPPLSSALAWFLIVTCMLSLALGSIPNTLPTGVSNQAFTVRTQVIVWSAVMSVFFLEIVANGGVPLVLIARGADVSYQDFGLPVIHVAFSGTCYFFAVYWFDLYLVSRLKTMLFLAVSAIATSLMIVSRGAFVVTALAFVAVYLQRRGISKKLVVGVGLMGGALLWGFGFLGDIRTHGASGESIILAVGDASDKFRNSNIPTELFWPYLYASSPLANLQLNVTERVLPDSPMLYVILELLPDFVSKRLVSEDAIAASQPLLITPTLTVCTMYGRAFALMGWAGLVCNFLYFVAISAACLRILRNSKYRVATTAILCALAFLGIFDNLYIISGGIIQVLIPLLLRSFEPCSNPTKSDGKQHHHIVAQSPSSSREAGFE